MIYLVSTMIYLVSTIIYLVSTIIYLVSTIIYLVSTIIYLVSTIIYLVSTIIYLVSTIIYLVSTIIYLVSTRISTIIYLVSTVVSTKISTMIKRKFENVTHKQNAQKPWNRAFLCDHSDQARHFTCTCIVSSLLICWFISIYYLFIYLFIYLLFSKANAVYCDNFCIFPSSLTLLACGSDSVLSLESPDLCWVKPRASPRTS